MSIDPKILARMEGRSVMNQVEDNLAGIALPALTGTPKQVKWATTIRAEALALEWPPQVAATLRSINDSTWWIANKTIPTTMKFKEPAPHQLVGGPPQPQGRSTQPELTPQPSPTPAANLNKRLDDALHWAESVSRHPTLAHAAILAALAGRYSGEMKSRMKAKAQEILAQGDLEVNRDIDAIRLMLAKL